MFDIDENLKKLPDSPGVYMHRDKLGNVIYVGKAISLKNRVRQYFRSQKTMDAKVCSMVSSIEEFEYITTGSEMEALILECNLIKKYKPKYNVLLRDDKTYPYIKVTVKEDFPRLTKTRLIKRDGAKYFGPYSDTGAVNQMVDVLNTVYALKKCPMQKFNAEHRPCLNYHIGRCSGVCSGNADRDKYMERVEQVLDFLKGRNKELETYLKNRMSAASEALDYERAADFRDQLAALHALEEKQRVVLKDSSDLDLIMVVGGERERHVVLFSVREGKLIDRQIYEMQYRGEDTSEDMISAFIKQHYSEGFNVPSGILLEKMPKDALLMEEYLHSLSGRSVNISVPKKGERKALLSLALRDAAEMTKTIDERIEAHERRRLDIGREIFNLLLEMGKAPAAGYSGHDFRLEAYDISNTNGVDTVGAMVVFKGLLPQKNDYRKFKVRTVEGPNDYGSMQEILVRRLKRAAKGDKGFVTFPDLILVDGGKGHVTAAETAVKAFGKDIALAGMVKDDRHRTRALVFQKDGDTVEISLKRHPLLYKYIGTIQEEVHRFAIDYHRKLRGNSMLTSVLDEIAGIGPVTRNALLAHFGSVDAIREASREQLMEVKGITDKLSGNIIAFFDNSK